MLIAIQETPIHQNKDGLYSLNDIHRIAGGEAKDQPSNWLRLDKTIELIEAYSNSSELSSTINTKAGRYGGTYVREELVYAYAGWISAEFYKLILDTFTASRKHAAIRLQTKDAQLKMTDALKESRDKVMWYQYANEADMINRIVIGMSAKEYRDAHGLVSSDNIRDHVTTEELYLIDQLLITDSHLINVGMDYDERRELLQVRHDKLRSSRLAQRIINQ